MSPRNTTVSIAVPLLNEEAVLPQLLARLRELLAAIPGGPHEIVFVDDGSTDRTFEMLRAATQEDSRITALSLSRNFGHQAALCAALDQAHGDVVVLMDGDLQDSPDAVHRMLDAYHRGYDVVYAVRTRRKESLLLRACYHLFYRVIGKLAEVKLPHDAGDFCLMSRRVVDELNAAPERHRYLRGLRAWVGFKQIGIPVVRAARKEGESKYNWRRLFKLASDGIFSFSVVPLRAAALLGGITLLGSTLWAMFIVGARLFFDHSPQGFTALAVSISFFSGVQLLFLGVIGEYVGRIYEEVKGRPKYIVQQVAKCLRPWTPNTPAPIESFTGITGGGVLENR
ncbi:MAG: glycosyltransferase family 2 protein [Planctomycetia bacterium]|nr:glycosyltransferase family 2 protein [Planctomycetia bacterium]